MNDYFIILVDFKKTLVIDKDGEHQTKRTSLILKSNVIFH